jgi:hypothetical protein
MAEINKLSVGQALDKLRGTEAPKTRMTRLDGKIGELDKEIQQLRATNRRIERDQGADLAGRGAEEAPPRRLTKARITWIVIAIVMAIPILIWKSGLLSP